MKLDFSKENLMKIYLLGSELLHAMGTRDKANSHFSQFYEYA
jgi:hypothetical protein